MSFEVEANKALNRAEDPRKVLDHSYQRQVEMPAGVRWGLADLAPETRARAELARDPPVDLDLKRRVTIRDTPVP